MSEPMREEAELTRPTPPNPAKIGKKTVTLAWPVMGTIKYVEQAEAYMNAMEAANREKDAEIARLTTQCEVDNSFAKFCQKKAADSQTLLREAESQLASLRASGGEKWIDVKQELPPNDSRIEIGTHFTHWRIVAPPTLTRE